MKYGMFIKPIRAYVHMIFDKEHLFGVTRGFNIMWDYYDRAENVQNENHVQNVNLFNLILDFFNLFS